MKQKDKEYFTGERIYFGYSDKMCEEAHVNRYKLVLDFIVPGDICLDATCGSGYGTELLSSKASKVIGIDVSNHAINYAKKNHCRSNIKFLLGDLNNPLQFPNGYFDLVVSFETIEHIVNQTLLIREFHRILKTNGLLIISTPDRIIYSGKAKIRNRFHVTELSKDEFLKLISQYFKIEGLYGQIKYTPLSFSKRLMKLAAKLDVYRIRDWFMKTLRLKKIVSRAFSTGKSTNIEKINFKSEHNYYQLLIVSRKL